ncbi:aminotransferase class V-fold PLP-dependent enzyme [Amycolatopsis japonica]|uniref:aminotransferase class V-fold PLP-dependent enzyme n=1 Tax=Amycolatopsis japonica TaxID=208439 RepID=UPI003329FC77
MQEGGLAQRSAVGVCNRRLSDIDRMLSDSYGVMCRSGHLCAQPLVDHRTTDEVLRISVYVYNSEDEIGRVFEAMAEIHEALGNQNGSGNRR